MKDPNYYSITVADDEGTVVQIGYISPEDWEDHSEEIMENCVEDPEDLGDDNED